MFKWVKILSVLSWVVNKVIKLYRTMTEEKGFLTADQEAALGQLADKAVDFTKVKYFGWLEAIDDKAFTYGIRYLDNTFGDKLGADYKKALGELADAAIKEDWAACVDPLSELLDHLVDIPIVSGDAEAKIIHAVVYTIFELIESHLAKKNA
jgi:hypothetical protein